jgi:tRNA dimethylallyltransferase
VIRVAALVGATAVGKTTVALRLAQKLDAEIVSLDSMQIYRGMDVGTATPGADDLARVRHHLINLRDPEDNVTVAEFQQLARTAIADISARGRLPFLVGGSGLYFRAVVDDLRFPPQDPKVRAAFEEEAVVEGPESLHARLARVDPDAAAKMEPRNTRRIVRALEVVQLTGRPFSEFAAAWERFDSIYDLRVAGLRRNRAELYERIARRVDGMIASGLLAEVDALRQGSCGRTAAQALGYRQVLEAPANASAQEVRDDIVRATKRFARRQESWFAADPRVVWFDATDAAVEASLEAFLSRKRPDGRLP